MVKPFSFSCSQDQMMTLGKCSEFNKPYVNNVRKRSSQVLLMMMDFFHFWILDNDALSAPQTLQVCFAYWCVHCG